MNGRDMLAAALVGTFGVVILMSFAYRTTLPLLVWLAGFVVSLIWSARK